MIENQIENIDYVICKLCGKQSKRITGSHIVRVHKMSLVQYRIQFPDAIVTSKKSYELKSFKARIVPRHKYKPWSKEALQHRREGLQKIYNTPKWKEACAKGAAARRLIVAETGKKISLANKAFYQTSEGKELRKNFSKVRKGKPNKKTSISCKTWHQSFEGKEFHKKMRLQKLGKPIHTQGSKERIRQVLLGIPRPPQVGIAVRKAQLGRKHTPEHIAKQQATMKIVKSYPEYWEKLQKGLKLRPNKFEQKVAKLLPISFSFSYTGDFNPNGMFHFVDGRNKNADFTQFPNRTKVIECFGNYWHDHPNNIETSSEEHEKDIVESYKAIGVDCLIIWEYEIKDMASLQSKIQGFVNVEIYKEL